jgi:acyl carrier protein
MDEKIFLGYVEKALNAEAGAVSLENQLVELNWDSLAEIVFISILDENEKLQVSAEELSNCETVAELYSLVKNP